MLGNAPSRRGSAQTADGGADSRQADATALELEWLLQTLSMAPGSRSRLEPEAHRERLSALLVALAGHLESEVGAAWVPSQDLKLVCGEAGRLGMPTDALIGQLERPVLSWVRRRGEPMLVNRGRAPGSPPLRLLAVPVRAHDAEIVGALLLIRPADSPEFTRRHVALASHVSRSIGVGLAPEVDAATGLLTRVSLRNGLERLGAPDHARGGSPHSVLAFKIDRLDIVNRTRGFDAGDAVVCGVGKLLRSSQMPEGALAARISGNEFVLVLPHTELEQAQLAAEALQRLSAPLAASLVGSQDPISVSCGIAAFESPREFEIGLAQAQLACRTARRHGAGRIEVYRDTDASMIQRHTDVFAVRLLREALREDRFTLYAQKIVPLRDSIAGEGYELLLRSLDDLGENRAPLHLLSAAHRNHLAPAVDLWVIEHALAEAAPYRGDLKGASVSLSINVTGPSLTDQKFLERARVLIEQSRIEPQLITFEITETVAVLSLAKAVQFIQELRALGCRFALDDFGTGVNSLKNLTSLPVDRVKVDGSFVADLLTNRQSESMVRAIVSLARDLGIVTVAEYAENPQIIDRLRELGIDYAQGYGVALPRPFADVLRDVRGQGADRRAEPRARSRTEARPRTR